MTFDADAPAEIVRRARPHDIEAIARLADSASTCAQWSRAAYSGYFSSGTHNGDLQVKAIFVACVPAFSGSGAIAEDHDSKGSKVTVGFVAFSALIGSRECELENMAVAAEWRGRGSGSRLLAAGLLWCRTWCTAGRGTHPENPIEAGMWLEVRASNASAIAFYKQAGFSIAGSRPAYYAQPVEDAVLMRKAFNVGLVL